MSETDKAPKFIKIASYGELMTLPPGFYELPERKDGEAYDPVMNEIFKGKLREVAVIRAAGQKLPVGCDLKVRRDGCVIATLWIPAYEPQL